ncbi:hypothetical protein [Catenulispora sp. GAS73]|uniref:hypothetical protein n=1 Tax=Catenulispora sp. GAS73 TaxID=3156269 RepID=UPI00351233DB
MRTNPDFAHLLQRMTHDMVDRIFDAMPQIEATHGIAPEDGYIRPITLFGGEPLLQQNRDLVEHILARAQQGGTRGLTVVTNATDLGAYEDLLGPENLADLQHSGRRTRGARQAPRLPGRSGIVRRDRRQRHDGALPRSADQHPPERRPGQRRPPAAARPDLRGPGMVRPPELRRLHRADNRGQRQDRTRDALLQLGTRSGAGRTACRRAVDERH